MASRTKRFGRIKSRVGERHLIKQLIGQAGLKIRAGDGCEEQGHKEMLSTPLFYPANPGDKLLLLDTDYKFNVATYRPEAEDRWIYTYDYAPDQSWTIYNKDLNADSYRQEEYIFTGHVYFRICLRKLNGENFNNTEDINTILRFETNPSVQTKKKWLINEVERVTEQVNSLQEKNDMKLIVITDTHYNVNGTWDDTCNAINELSKRIKFDGIIHLGDFTDGMVTKEATKHYAKLVLNDLKRTGLPVWVALGNHDVNYFKNNPEPFSPVEQSQVYLDGKAIRYHADLDGLRFIFIDSYDISETLRYGYSEECIKWLDNTLISTPANSKTIIFSHLPPLTRLQFWTDELRGESKLNEIIKQHKEKILAWINGHNHADNIDNDEDYPIVAIVNAKCEAFTDYKPKCSIIPDRKLDSVSQEAFDIILVNAKNKKIKFLRFGAGKDRVIINNEVRWE